MNKKSKEYSKDKNTIEEQLSFEEVQNGEEKELVLFNNPIIEKYFTLPEKPKNSHNATLSRIKNAWSKFAYVDETGVMWIDSARLNDILRTNKGNANYKLKDIPDESKKVIKNKLFIRGYEVRKLIDEAIQTEGVGKRKQYLKYSEEIYMAMRDCDFVENIRNVYYAELQDNRKTLKRKRIAKYNIVKDELTGDVLNRKTAEFSHIRSYSLFKDIADDIENGLIINKTTHDIISKENINDEKELIELCNENGWNKQWYDRFIRYFFIE